MGPIPRSSKRGSYHHGNAKTALLEAATALLEKEGATGLSLRQVALSARLSRQAPYNHFADKEALLAELAKLGFTSLATEMRTAAELPDDSALTEAASVYIKFAQSAPALFRLMFSRELVELSKYPDAAAAAGAAFDALASIVARYTTPARIAELSLAAWSIVHGYAMLCIETNLESDAHRGSRALLFAHVIQAEAKYGIDR